MLNVLKIIRINFDKKTILIKLEIVRTPQFTRTIYISKEMSTRFSWSTRDLNKLYPR